MNENTYIIAYFDILGTEANQKVLPLATLVSQIEQFSELGLRNRSRLVIDGMVNPKLNPDGSITAGSAIGVHHVDTEIFSDTNIFWCIFDHRRLQLFCETCSEFFCQALNKRIPLRGGIAVGPAHMDKEKRVFVGLPLTEAARVEKAQLWVGVSFGPSFTDKPFKTSLPIDQVLFFSAHRKSGYSQLIPGIVLDWPRKFKNMFNKTPIRILSELNTENKYSDYYEHAIKFVELSDERYINQE